MAVHNISRSIGEDFFFFAHSEVQDIEVFLVRSLDLFDIE